LTFAPASPSPGSFGRRPEAKADADIIVQIDSADAQLVEPAGIADVMPGPRLNMIYPARFDRCVSADRCFDPGKVTPGLRSCAAGSC
jgi:hypothetical protein